MQTRVIQLDRLLADVLPNRKFTRITCPACNGERFIKLLDGRHCLCNQCGGDGIVLLEVEP